MNRRYFHSRRVLPPLEVELPRQHTFRPTPQPSRPNTFNLRNNRTRRPQPQRTAEERTEKPCSICYNLVPSSTYNEHLAYCQNESQQQANRSQDHIMELELDPPQRQFLVRPSPHREENTLNNTELIETSQEVPRLENPQEMIPQPMMPEMQDMHNQLPFPGFLNPMNGQHNPPNGQFVFHAGQENQMQDQLNQPEQPVNAPPFTGRIFEPGATGAIFRLRAIESIINRLEQNGGGQETGMEQRGLLSILSMLAGLQGMRAAHFGAFLHMLNRERGLDRQVLESLPVVVYTEEGFKNVEEESKKCSICLDCYEEQEEVKFLWCLHRFHKSCVDPWLERHTNCPFCKKDYAEALRNQAEAEA